MLRPALAILALLGLAACETTTGGANPAIDPQARTLDEAINAPSDGAENEIEVPG